MLLWADLTNAYVWMTMLVFIGFSAVGFIDDFEGIPPSEQRS